MPDASQVESTKKVEGAPDAPATLSPKDVAEKLKTADPGSPQDVKALIEKDPVYQQILSWDDKKLDELDALLRESQPQSNAAPDDKKPTGAAATPAATPQGSAAPAAEPEKEITISLKPSDLGTYLANRTPQEAVLELVKGKRNADETIKFYKEQSLPTLEKTAQSMFAQNQLLKKELEGLKKQPAGAGGPEGTKPTEPPKIAIPEIPDDVDLFDPEQQKVLVGTLKALRDQNIALSSEITQMRSTPPAPQPQVAPAPQAIGLPDEVKSEYNQISLMQMNPEYKEVFSTKVPIEELERQYVAWVESLAKINGLTEIYDAKGRFVPRVSTLISQYLDPSSADGGKLRTVAEQSGAKPPEDISTLSRIYAVRNVRNQYSRRDESGVVVSISYEEAARIAKSLTPELFTISSSPSTSPSTSEREAIARGVERRSQFAVEVPAARGAQVDEISNMDFNEFQRLMKKPRVEYTTQEAETVRRLLKELASFSDKEVEDWFKQPGG